MIEQCDCVYFAASKGLTEIPDDIPDDTPHIVLLDNLITQIKSRTFVDKSVCTQMSLGQNDIQRIEKEAFFGMDALEGLDLHMNRLRFEESVTELKCDGGTAAKSVSRVNILGDIAS